MPRSYIGDGSKTPTQDMGLVSMEGEDTLCTAARLARALLSAPPPSEAAIGRAKLLVLDTIGCGLLGAREETPRHVAEICRQTGDCPVMGRERRAPLLDAVLMNGAAVRALDFNDYLVSIVDGEPETGGHPSDNIPVALAAGSVYGRSGFAILAAIASGYEIYARLQGMIGRDGPWDGVCASGLASAAIAGLLIGLDEAEMAHALALGATRSATPSIVRRGKLSAAKTIANALIAQSGVQAALLAASGITGPLQVLDSRFGLRGLFAQYDPERLAHPIPAEGALMRAHIKAFPCVNTGQGVVASALALHRRLRGGADALARIELLMPDYRVIARQQDDPARRRPASRETADHSFPFLAAAALIDGEFGLKQFANERWNDPRVKELMDRIVMRRIPAIADGKSYPFACTIAAAGPYGRDYAASDLATAEPLLSGAGEEAVSGKFHAILSAHLPEAAREAIVDAVMELDQCPSTAQLDRAIAIGETDS